LEVGFAAEPRYIRAVETVFTYLIFGAMAAVVIVLLIGVGSMFRGGDFNRKYSNKLMRLRILLQALALVLFAIFMLFIRNHG
jgi:hypothetical protein